MTTSRISNNILSSRFSKYVNCWKIQLDCGTYAVMPAHVAIYKNKNDCIWQKSNFLEMCNGENINKFGNLKWFVSEKWKFEQMLEDDLAWTKIENDLNGTYSNGTSSNGNTFETSNVLDNMEPLDVNFYFNQPVDYKGQLCHTASFGKQFGSIYPSPNSKLFEAVSVGFKGMSGAVVLDSKSDKFVGMLIRRGTDLGTKYIDKSNVSYNFANSSTMSRAMIMPTSMISQHIKNGGVEII